MRSDYVDITLLLDESGSMFDVVDDTIGGVNRLIKEQQAQPGFATFSLIKFDDRYSRLFDAADIHTIPPITDAHYRPTGSTALLDAVFKSITETGKRLAEMAEQDRPGKVLFVIITDGAENSSREATREQVQELVKRQQDVYKWEFLFMGASIDSFAAGGGIGLSAQSIANVGKSAAGITSAYIAASQKLTSSRVASVAGVAYAMSFDEQDYQKMDDTIDDVKLKNTNAVQK